MEVVLILILSVLVAMGLLAGQQYVAPKFSQLQSVQASYAGNVAVTAVFIFVSLFVAAFLGPGGMRSAGHGDNGRQRDRRALLLQDSAQSQNALHSQEVYRLRRKTPPPG